MPAIRPALLALLLAAGSAGAAELLSVRVADVQKDSVRLRVQLTEPAEVGVSFGEAPMEWTGFEEDRNALEEHEIRLPKLTPDRQYFYQLSVDGVPLPDVLTLRSGRSWVTRRATILVTGDTPSGGGDEASLADALFAQGGDLLVALGGDGGNPDAFAALHARSLAERRVVEVGSPGAAEPLELVSFADVALASLGTESLAHAGPWATAALAGVEGACWPVLASASRDAAAGLATLARQAGALVVLTRAESPSVSMRDGVVTVALTDPDTDGGPPCFAVLRFEEGRLEATLRDPSGAVLGQAELQRDCPLPEMSFDVSGDDLGDEPGGTDLGDLDEQCDE